MNVYEAAAKYRHDLAAMDSAAVHALTAEYANVVARIMAEHKALSAKYAEALLAGKKPGLSWLFQQKRYVQLLATVQGELEAFAASSLDVMAVAVASAADKALSEAKLLVQAGEAGVDVSTWSNMNAGAVERIIGGVEGPLGALLGSLAPTGVGAARAALVQGVALGRNPRKVAQQLRKALGVPLWRAHTIASTEILRAYRSTTQAAWQQNAHLVKSWTWWAALDKRTCPVCWAMHGTTHKLDEIMGTHPRCRCTMVPNTLTYNELLGTTGLKDSQPSNYMVGTTHFKKLPDADQRAILGPGKFDAFKAGDIDLRDLVGYVDHPVWGPSRHQVSLASAKAAHGAKAAKAASTPKKPSKAAVAPSAGAGEPAAHPALKVSSGEVHVGDKLTTAGHSEMVMEFEVAAIAPDGTVTGQLWASSPKGGMHDLGPQGGVKLDGPDSQWHHKVDAPPVAPAGTDLPAPGMDIASPFHEGLTFKVTKVEGDYVWLESAAGDKMTNTWQVLKGLGYEVHDATKLPKVNPASVVAPPHAPHVNPNETSLVDAILGDEHLTVAEQLNAIADAGLTDVFDDLHVVSPATGKLFKVMAIEDDFGGGLTVHYQDGSWGTNAVSAQALEVNGWKLQVGEAKAAAAPAKLADAVAEQMAVHDTAVLVAPSGAEFPVVKLHPGGKATVELPDGKPSAKLTLAELEQDGWKLVSVPESAPAPAPAPKVAKAPKVKKAKGPVKPHSLDDPLPPGTPMLTQQGAKWDVVRQDANGVTLRKTGDGSSGGGHPVGHEQTFTVADLKSYSWRLADPGPAPPPPPVLEPPTRRLAKVKGTPPSGSVSIDDALTQADLNPHAGSHFAWDEGAAEGLDVRVRKVDYNGETWFELKVKLRGDAIQQADAKLSSLGAQRKSGGDVTLPRQDAPAAPGGAVRYDPDQDGMRVGGTQLRWRTPDRHAFMYRGTENDNYAMDGTVQLLLKGRPTPDAVRRALRDLVEVPDGYPSATVQREYAKNALAAAFQRGRESVVDTLARVEGEYGIKPGDIVWRRDQHGKLQPELPDWAAKTVADRAGVKGFTHQLSDSSDDALVRILASDQQAIMSTTQRFLEGVNTTGMSSSADLGTGGAEYVFTRQGGGRGRSAGTFQIKADVLRRLDYFSYDSDRFGRTAGSGYESRDSQASLKNHSGSRETMFRHRISFDDVAYLNVRSGQKAGVIAKLHQLGVTKLGGRSLEDFIREV